MTGGAPVIVQCAVTGSQPADVPSPHLPRTPTEIADAAIEAWRAGAAMVHIHARDEDGSPTASMEHFTAIVDRIRASEFDGIINLSTSAAGGTTDGSERYACLELEPEVASYDCGSLNFADRIFPNPMPFLREMGAAFREAGVRPEIECFEPGHIAAALRLREEGVLDDPLTLQLVLGVKWGAPGTIEQAVHMRSMLPEGANWFVCGIGRAQLPLNLYGLAAGAHVRTGLEDNLYYHRGEPAESNGQLVERVVRLAGEVGRPVATPDEAREILSL
ncbi:MAG: 3-keto-5-aminohexanoate cleavage protein [Solirubrobacterales bacterium]